MHSFYIGDVAEEPQSSVIQFIAYEVQTKNGTVVREDVIGVAKLLMAQVWVDAFSTKKKKSLGLYGSDGGPDDGREVARFNISYMLIAPENTDHIEKESRTLVQKLRDKRSEVRESLIEPSQELPEEDEEEIPDWRIVADMRAAHNLG